MPFTYLQDQEATEQPKSQGKFSYIDENEPTSANPAFLPNENKVVSEQYARPDSVQRLKEEIMHDPKNLQEAVLQTPVTALKAAAIPFQRAEAAVSNVGMEAQKGNTNPYDYLTAAAQGIMGQRQGELGDLVRTTGFGGKANEPIAKAVGLTASLPLVADVGRGIEKTAEGTANATDWMSGKSMSEYLRPKDKNMMYGKHPENVVADERIRATNSDDLLAQMKDKQKEVGQQIGEVKKDNPVQVDLTPSIKIIDNQIAKLQKDNPKEMSGLIKRLQDKKSDLLHEVTDEKGNVTSSDDLSKVNLADAHDLKTRAKATATNNIFSTAPAQDNIYNETMRNVYRSVTAKMNTAEPNLIPLNKRYGNLDSAISALESRKKVADRNTGLMGDTLSGGLGGVIGTAAHVGIAPGVAAGVVAHKIGQTALFKTNLSILLKDVSIGAKSVQELAHSFLQIPQAVRTKILQESPEIRLQLHDLLTNEGNLGMAGQAGSKGLKSGIEGHPVGGGAPQLQEMTPNRFESTSPIPENFDKRGSAPQAAAQYTQEHPYLAEKWKNFGKGAGAIALAGGMVASGNANASSILPQHETSIIQKVAKAYNLTPEQTKFLQVIRKVEHGGAGKEFGVLTPGAMRFKHDPNKSFETQARWAAGSIKNHYKTQKDIDKFARRWAPQGVANDPNNLNKNWSKNAKFYMQKLSSGGSK